MGFRFGKTRINLDLIEFKRHIKKPAGEKKLSSTSYFREGASKKLSKQDRDFLRSIGLQVR